MSLHGEMKTLNLTGHQYGRLTVTCEAPQRGKQKYWHCVCECKNELEVAANNLRSGSVVSCGCIRRKHDLAGQRIGEWTVLSRSDRKGTNRDSYWNCICSCGVQKVVRQLSLVTQTPLGMSRSCGHMIDLTGDRFGRLLVLGEAPRLNGLRHWLCLCDCGNCKSVWMDSLRRGDILSCGCFQSEIASAQSRTHGCAGAGVQTSEYGIWSKMKARCNNPNGSSWQHYGGRGIKVCDRWLNSFEAFLEDMGLRPSKGYSIERIDVNLGYAPENCRWATTKEQMNNKRNNIMIEWKGQTKTVSQWSEIVGLPIALIRERWKRGWDADRVLGEPKQIAETYTHDGKTLTLPQWGKELGIAMHVLNRRRSDGWPVGEMLATPVRGHVNLKSGVEHIPE